MRMEHDDNVESMEKDMIMVMIMTIMLLTIMMEREYVCLLITYYWNVCTSINYVPLAREYSTSINYILSECEYVHYLRSIGMYLLDF